MVAYKPIAAVTVVAAPDQTYKNTGNLTSHFPGSVLPNANIYEINKMLVTGGPVLATATIIAKGKPWSFVQLGISGGNEWDPSQPLLFTADSELYFLWSIAAPGVAGQIPSVTVWPRYDADLPENKYLST